MIENNLVQYKTQELTRIVGRDLFGREIDTTLTEGSKDASVFLGGFPNPSQPRVIRIHHGFVSTSIDDSESDAFSKTGLDPELNIGNNIYYSQFLRRREDREDSVGVLIYRTAEIFPINQKNT